MKQHRGVLVSAIALLILVSGTVGAQTLLTQMTWGGTGSDVADAIASAPDGSSYVVGITDSFATDQFGSPARRIFIVKFNPDGSLAWQRIWNGATIVGSLGLRRTGVAVGVGAVYAAGVSASNNNDAVLLKFDENGTLLWERAWGGPGSDAAFGVAVDSDGSAYISGTTDSFGAAGSALFVVKFNPAGNVLWQRIFDGAQGDAVAVGLDGSVYAAGTRARDALGHFDLLALKITAAGDLVWQRAYSTGDVADPRGGMAVSSDGSIVIAGGAQTPKAGIVPLATLMIKLGADGSLVFERQFNAGDGAATGVAVAPDDNSIYVTGTTSSLGAGFQDVFVLHLQPTGKKVLDAFTWGGPAFEEGGGVGVTSTTFALGATTNAPPPYSFLPAAARVSTPKSTLSDPQGSFTVVAGTSDNPAAGASAPNGSTTFSGNNDVALVRIAR